MQVIYKYPLEITEIQEINIIGYVKTLTVQIQYNIPCLWVLIDDKDKSINEITIRTLGTGHQFLSTSLDYIGTYQLNQGALVFHVFQNKH